MTPDAGNSKDPAPYGSTFKSSDLVPIPPWDLPFGVPKWLGNGDTAKRMPGKDQIGWTPTASEG